MNPNQTMPLIFSTSLLYSPRSQWLQRVWSNLMEVDNHKATQELARMCSHLPECTGRWVGGNLIPAELSRFQYWLQPISTLGWPNSCILCDLGKRSFNYRVRPFLTYDKGTKMVGFFYHCIFDTNFSLEDV